jgi:hypothetical protein
MATVWRCAYESVRGGALIVNTFHQVWRDDVGGTSPASADQVRDALDTALTTKYKAIMPSDATVQGLAIVEEVDPAGTAVPQSSYKSINAAGSRTPTSLNLSPAVCILVSIKTNAAVRSGHGRMWMPPALGHDTIQAPNTWTTSNAYYTAVTAFMNELNSNHTISVGLTNGHLATVIYSRTRRERGDSNYYFDMTGYAIRSDQRFLRSRLTAP